jgi:hypothetical protein
MHNYQKIHAWGLSALAGLFLVVGNVEGTLIDIDSFSDGEAVLNGGENRTISASTAVGGLRYISVTGHYSRVSIEVNTPDYIDLCTYNSDSRYNGSFLLEYGHSSDLNLNLNQTGSAFRIVISEINPGTGSGTDTLTLTVLADGITESHTFDWPTDIGNFDIPFSTFPTITNWTDVDRLTFLFTGRNAAGLTIDAITMVPEPTITALLSAGSLLYRRKK